MALVIAHAELVSDQTSDPRTAPQRRREAVRLGAFQQQRLEAFELRGVQQRLTAGRGRPGATRLRRHAGIVAATR